VAAAAAAVALTFFSFLSLLSPLLSAAFSFFSFFSLLGSFSCVHENTQRMGVSQHCCLLAAELSSTQCAVNGHAGWGATGCCSSSCMQVQGGLRHTLGQGCSHTHTPSFPSSPSSPSRQPWMLLLPAEHRELGTSAGQPSSAACSAGHREILGTDGYVPWQVEIK
jgi:hypothetical protein